MLLHTAGKFYDLKRFIAAYKLRIAFILPAPIYKIAKNIFKKICATR